MGQYASYTAAFKLKAAEYLRPSGMANVLLVVTSALTRFVSCTGEVSTTNKQNKQGMPGFQRREDCQVSIS